METIKGLGVGQRFRIGDRTCTLTGFDVVPNTPTTGSQSTFYSFNTQYVIQLQYDDGVEDLYGPHNIWKLHGFMILDGKLNLGDHVVIKIDDPLVDNPPRGKIIEIDDKASEFPYKVLSLDNTLTGYFNCRGINKLMTALSYEKVGESVKIMRELVEQKKSELVALEIALEVLEFSQSGR